MVEVCLYLKCHVKTKTQYCKCSLSLAVESTRDLAVIWLRDSTHILSWAADRADREQQGNRGQGTVRYRERVNVQPVQAGGECNAAFVSVCVCVGAVLMTHVILLFRPVPDAECVRVCVGKCEETQAVSLGCVPVASVVCCRLVDQLYSLSGSYVLCKFWEKRINRLLLLLVIIVITHFPHYGSFQKHLEKKLLCHIINPSINK